MYYGLGDDIPKYVRHALSINNSTPKEVLDNLSRDKDMLIKISVVRNKNTPEKTLSNMLSKKVINILVYVAKRENLSESLVKKLIRYNNKRVILELSKNNNINSKNYEYIFSLYSNDIDVCNELAKNYNISELLQKELVKKKGVHHNLVRNVRLKEDIIETLIKVGDIDTKVGLIKNLDLSIDKLEKLVVSKSYEVRKEASKKLYTLGIIREVKFPNQKDLKLVLKDDI